MNDQFTIDDFKAVIDKKVKGWKGTEWEKFLRPETLFGAKFESYFNARETQSKTSSNPFLDDLKAMGGIE